jgi:hypothetical protein
MNPTNPTVMDSPRKVTKKNKDKSGKKLKTDPYQGGGSNCSDRKIRVDEFGNPLKKKKKPKSGSPATSTTFADMHSGTDDSFFETNRPLNSEANADGDVDSMADTSQDSKGSGENLDTLFETTKPSSRRKLLSSSDSISTLGNLSAAEVVRQNHARLARQQKLHAKKQRQHEQYWKPAVYNTQQKQRSSRNQQHSTNDEVSVASTIVRALAQGASRAEREKSEQTRPVKPRVRAEVWDSPLTQDEGPGSGLRALLIQYLISIGTSPNVVEQMADQFVDQEDGGGSVFDSPLTTDGAPGGIRTLLIPYLVSLGNDPNVAERMFDELSDQHFGGAPGAASLRNKKPSSTRAPVYDSPLTARGEEPGDTLTLLVEYMISLGTDPEVAQRMMGQFSEHQVRRTASSTARQSLPVYDSPLTANDDPARAMLIQYLISVGADPKVADKMADLFNDRQIGDVVQRFPPSASSASARHGDAMSTRHNQMDSRNQGPPVAGQVSQISPMSQSKQSVQNSVSSSSQRRPTSDMECRSSTSQSKQSVQRSVSSSSQRRPTSDMECRSSTSQSKHSVQHSLSSSSQRRPASDMECRAFASHHWSDAEHHAGINRAYKNPQRSFGGFDIEADMTSTGENFIEVSHVAAVKDPYNNRGMGSVVARPIAPGTSAHQIEREAPRRGLMALICCRQSNQGD